MHSSIHFLKAHSRKVALVPRQPTEEENSICLLRKTSHRIAHEILQDRTRNLHDTDRQSTGLAERSFRGENTGVGYNKHYEEVGSIITSLFQR